MSTITTDEAEALIDDGVPFVDVRSIEEFTDGHVPGAVNIPLNLSGPNGMQPNPDFVRVVEAHFKKDEKFILACQAGGRSARALAQLSQAGYSTLLDMTAGFVGKKDAFGKVTPGWQAEGREIEVEGKEAQTYAHRLATAAG